MAFDPAKINMQQAQHQCEYGGRKSVCVKTEVCFAYIIKSDKPDLKNVDTGNPHNSYDEVSHCVTEMIPPSFIFLTRHC